MAEAAGLRRTVGPLQYFALGFGCIIGAAWIVSLGEMYARAGPGGAVIGFVLGGAVMAIVGACYGELAAQLPRAGSEFVYCHHVYGRRTGFLVGWFITLFLVGVTIFEAVALAWAVRILVPSLEDTVLYTVLGSTVTLADVLIGIGGTLLLTMLNYRGTALSVAFHSAITYAFIAATGFVMLWIVAFGSAVNIMPLFGVAGGGPRWDGIFWVFASCAFFLYGFPAIPQAVEERAPGVGIQTVARLIPIVIVAATAFYIAIVITTAMAAPWPESAGRQLAMAEAIRRLPAGSALAAAILVAAAASILKTWNGVMLMAARMLLALSREGFLPAAMARAHPRFGTPGIAVLAVGLLNFAGLFLGNGVIVPIITMSSMCLAVTFVLCCAAVPVLRRRSGEAREAYRVPGGMVTVAVGIAGSAVMAVSALLAPLSDADGAVPVEWLLLLGWALAGGAVVVSAGRRGRIAASLS